MSQGGSLGWGACHCLAPTPRPLPQAGMWMPDGTGKTEGKKGRERGWKSLPLPNQTGRALPHTPPRDPSGLRGDSAPHEPASCQMQRLATPPQGWDVHLVLLAGNDLHLHNHKNCPWGRSCLSLLHPPMSVGTSQACSTSMQPSPCSGALHCRTGVSLCRSFWLGPSRDNRDSEESYGLCKVLGVNASSV